MVDEILPKVALPSVLVGALNCGVLVKLNASQRNCTRCLSFTRNSLNRAKSQVLVAGASKRFTPAVPYPSGPMKRPSPAQPLHFERTNASVLNHRSRFRPSVTRVTLAPGAMWGRGELSEPVLCESPFWVTLTGSPEVSWTIPLIAHPPNTSPVKPFRLRKKGISQTLLKTNRK